MRTQEHKRSAQVASSDGNRKSEGGVDGAATEVRRRQADREPPLAPARARRQRDEWRRRRVLVQQQQASANLAEDDGVLVGPLLALL